jgi:molybdenum cofactor cytidylyltransferase
VTDRPRIAAIVAAAGRSTRMGTPKQLLPWAGTTVISTVVANLSQAGADPVLVVVGHEREAVEAALTGSGAIIIVNPEYGNSEMLRSFQIAFSALKPNEISGALLALADQPHVPVPALEQIIKTARDNDDDIIIPSYEMRRGHPIYIPVSLREELLSLTDNETLRTLLTRHAGRIRHVTVDTPAILSDMDTPQEYDAIRPPE